MLGPALILFDIDGTLVAPTGLGRRSLERAFQALFGTVQAFDGVRFHGRTDPDIFAEGLRALGLDPEAHYERALEAYLEGLAMEVCERPPQLLPGVLVLLEQLAQRSDFVLGLVTGNVPRAAALKLGPSGLWARFGLGGFGGEAKSRAELIRIAADRCRARHGAPRRVVYIGDTELDVQAAREACVPVIGVATGGVPREVLAASEPDHLLDSLEFALSPLEELLR